MLFIRNFQKKTLGNLFLLKISIIFSSLYSFSPLILAKDNSRTIEVPLNYLKCINSLKLAYKNHIKPEMIKRICQDTQVLPKCEISSQYNIVHYDRMNSDATNKNRKVLVLSAFHGDEPESLAFTLQWIYKLMSSKDLGSDFSWRVVPLVNPLGLIKGTRTNGNRVDINRNFPTNEWDRDAIKYWKEKKKSDPRRFPGRRAGSESEVKCVISHVEEFRPNFVIAVHTPYGLLDMDGPLLGHNFPSVRGFPWKKLGTKTGSLGRYLWNDRGIPVLTIELPHSSIGYSKMQKMFTFSNQVIEKTLHYMNK